MTRLCTDFLTLAMLIALALEKKKHKTNPIHNFNEVKMKWSKSTEHNSTTILREQIIKDTLLTNENLRIYKYNRISIHCKLQIKGYSDKNKLLYQTFHFLKFPYVDNQVCNIQFNKYQYINGFLITKQIILNKQKFIERITDNSS